MAVDLPWKFGVYTNLLLFSGHDKSSDKEWYIYPALVALSLSVIDFLYFFMKFKETLSPEKRLKSLEAALNQAITYVNPVSLFNFQSLDNLKEDELASLKTIGLKHGILCINKTENSSLLRGSRKFTNKIRTGDFAVSQQSAKQLFQQPRRLTSLRVWQKKNRFQKLGRFNSFFK